MGFSAFPPKAEINAAVASIQMWSERADAAIFHIEPPWKYLLAGGNATAHVDTVHLPLAQFYRSKGLKLFVTFDATDGLGRDRDARELREAGRSIAESPVQQLYRAYVVAFVQAVHPEYVGLGAETNLIRAVAPTSIYSGLKAMLNHTAADVRAAMPDVTLYTTIQVETAWGRLPFTGQYVGVGDDLRDFPFAQVLGLSSYPYVGNYTSPAQIPDDYFSRIANDRSLPLFVAEGGFTSASVTGFQSSPQLQADYVRRMGDLLTAANAFAWFQLNFTDIDLTAFPVPPGYEDILAIFTRIGFVDSELRAKPSLAVWDSLFASRAVSR
jgi:hypothetical protein